MLNPTPHCFDCTPPRTRVVSNGCTYTNTNLVRHYHYSLAGPTFAEVLMYYFGTCLPKYHNKYTNVNKPVGLRHQPESVVARAVWSAQVVPAHPRNAPAVSSSR